MMILSPKQRGVALGAAGAAMSCLGFLWMAVHFNPLAYSDSLALQQRLSVALYANLFLTLCLTVAIGRLANHRFFTPDDIDGGGLTSGTDQAKVLQALLQNTLEQVVLASLVYMASAILLPASWLSAVPVAALLFAAGRFAFFATYKRGAVARAFGFGLFFYPSVGLLLCLIFAGLRSVGGA